MMMLRRQWPCHRHQYHFNCWSPTSIIKHGHLPDLRGSQFRWTRRKLISCCSLNHSSMNSKVRARTWPRPQEQSRRVWNGLAARLAALCTRQSSPRASARLQAFLRLAKPDDETTAALMVREQIASTESKPALTGPPLRTVLQWPMPSTPRSA